MPGCLDAGSRHRPNTTVVLMMSNVAVGSLGHKRVRHPQTGKVCRRQGESGRYNSAGEVVREALRLLEERPRLRRSIGGLQRGTRPPPRFSRPGRSGSSRRGAPPVAAQIRTAPEVRGVSGYILGSDALLDLEDILEYIATDGTDAARSGQSHSVRDSNRPTTYAGSGKLAVPEGAGLFDDSGWVGGGFGAATPSPVAKGIAASRLADGPGGHGHRPMGVSKTANLRPDTPRSPSRTAFLHMPPCVVHADLTKSVRLAQLTHLRSTNSLVLRAARVTAGQEVVWHMVCGVVLWLVRVGVCWVAWQTVSAIVSGKVTGRRA